MTATMTDYKPRPKPTATRADTVNVLNATGLEINNEPQKRRAWEKQLAHTWGMGDRGEGWTHGMCKGCARDIDPTPTVAEMFGERIELPSTVCDDCMTLVRSFYDPSGAAEVQEVSSCPKFDAKCPERLLPVVLGEIRPPRIDWQAFDKVKGWQLGQKGLALMGEEGSGKTTALWALFRELELQGEAPVFLGSLEMARVLAEAARDIRDVSWMARCRVLIIDDLGKEKATASVAALFWEVLNERYNRNLPLIVSSRFTGDEFVARFGETHLGEDIRRRMNAICQPVRFTLSQH